MKIKQLLEIQEVVEGRISPCDMIEILDLEYYSESKEETIKIGDMHLTHFLRVFRKFFEKPEAIEHEISKLKKELKKVEEMQKLIGGRENEYSQ